jgi:hypothetical protein
MAVLALPVLASELKGPRPSQPDDVGGRTSRSVEIASLATRALVILGLACFLGSLIPTKRAPDDRHYKFGDTLTSMIRNDVQQGKSVLLSHGSMPLLLAGLDEVPLDRGNSVLELGSAGMASSTGTAQRIMARAYDRIYLISAWWYGQEIGDLLDVHYQSVGEIPSAPIFEGLGAGYQDFLLGPAVILKPRKQCAAPTK